METREFKKHLQDLAHGRHHPEEHDWPPDGELRKTNERVDTKHGQPKKSIVRKTRRSAK